MQGWVVAISLPQAEAKAVANVQRAGFECFYPRIKRTLRRRGKRFHYLTPLFVSYFFVRLESTCAGLFDAFGVAGVLMANGTLAMVPEPVMLELRKRCDREGIYIQPPKPRFKVGQMVRPKTGAFAGWVGFFDGSAKNTESALFDLFGRQVKVAFSEGDLVAA